MTTILRSLLLCLLLLPVLVQADEVIKDYDVTLQVQADGKLLVTERIRVQAEGKQIRRGIYRDVPESYREQFNLKHRSAITLISVTRDGKPEGVSIEQNDAWSRFYIGAYDQELKPGEYTYELTYQVESALLFHGDYDELYWNVTGNQWIFPIENASAEVVLPAGAAIKNLVAYTGSQGAKGDAYEVLEREASRVRIKITRPLLAEQGLTIALDWPAGVVTRPGLRERISALISNNSGLAVGLLLQLGLWLFYFLVWWQVGRDPKKGLLIPLFTPPAGVSPAMAGYLWNLGFKGGFSTAKAFSVWLTEMAIGKHLRISEEANHQRFKLTYCSTQSSALPKPDQDILSCLFANEQPGEEVEVRKENRSRLSEALDNLKSGVKESTSQWFSTNMDWWGVGVWLALISCGVTAFLSGAGEEVAVTGFGSLFVGIFLWFFLSNIKDSAGASIQIIPALMFGIVALIFLPILFVVAASSAITWVMLGFALPVVLFKYLLPAPSQEGRGVLDALEGYREYLQLGESELLDLVGNSPAMDIALYEQHLPYAMALGVEDKWASRFSSALRSGLVDPDQAVYQPSWYHGHGEQSSPTALSSAISSGLTDATALATTPVDRSGSGFDRGSFGGGGSSGGSSGGGSSGGGRGGGGGGGW